MPIDIFESFYKQCISNLEILTEDGTKSNRKNVPVATKDAVDLKIRSNVLSANDNTLKTESILAFFLGNEMWKYVTERCVDKVRKLYEGDSLLKNCMINPIFKNHFIPFFEKVLKANNKGELISKNTWTVFVKYVTALPAQEAALYEAFRKNPLYAEYKKEVAALNAKETKQSAEDTIFLFCEMGILGQKTNNLYENNSKDSNNFYGNKKSPQGKNSCIKLQPPSYDKQKIIDLIESPNFNPGRALDYTRPEDFKTLLKWFRDNNLTSPDDNQIISIAASLKYFVDNGIPQSKLRKCPAFTYELNNNDEYQTSKGYINSPMTNILRPSKLQVKTVRGFVGKTMTNALRRASQDILQAASIVSEIKNNDDLNVFAGEYEHEKVKEANAILGIMSSKINTVSDFYNKFSRILNFAGDLGKYDEKDYVARRNTKDEETLNALNRANETIDEAKKLMKFAISSLPPVFADIIALTQVMFGHNVSKQPHDNASMYSFNNPDTGAQMNFIIPTEDLAAAIEKERYRNTFFEMDEYSSLVGKQRVMTTLVSDTMMSPDEMIVGPGKNVKIANLQSADETMKELLSQIKSLGEKETPTANFIKKYYVDQKAIADFRKLLEKNKGTVTVRSADEILNIGTYINEHANTNVSVEFVYQNANIKNAWAQTEMIVQNYYSETTSNIAATSVRIRTPISAIDAEKSILASETGLNAESRTVLTPQMLEKEIGDDKINAALKAFDTEEEKTRSLLQLMIQTAIKFKIDRQYEDKSEISETMMRSSVEFSKYFCSPGHLFIKISQPIDDNYLKTVFFPVVTTILNSSWKVIAYGMMYTNMVWNSDIAFDSQLPDEPKETTIDEIVSDLQNLCTEIKNRFISRASRLTHRSMTAAFSAADKDDMINFWQTQNPNNALKSILNKVVESGELFAQSRMASNYVRGKILGGSKFKAYKAKKAINRLNGLVGAAAGMAAYPSLTNQIIIPKISIPDTIESLNNIGTSYIDLIKSIMMDPDSYHFTLSFKACLDQFATLIKSIYDDSGLNVNDWFFADAVVRLIKLYFEGTYLMYLSLAMGKPGFQEKIGSKKSKTITPVFPLVTPVKTEKMSDNETPEKKESPKNEEEVPKTNADPLKPWSGWNKNTDFDVDF